MQSTRENSMAVMENIVNNAWISTESWPRLGDSRESEGFKIGAVTVGQRSNLAR